MRILHIVPGLRSGGVAQVVYDLSKSQCSKGWEVTILSMHKDGYDDNIQRFSEIGVKINIEIIKSRFDISVINRLKKIIINFDIVHVHLFPNQLYAAIASKLIRKNKRPKLITTEHNTWNNRRKYKVFRQLDRYMYSAYDKIVSISPQTYNNLSKWLNSKKLSNKIFNINNGVDINRFQINQTNSLRVILDIPENHKIITMIARMKHPKDPITLVKAAAMVDKIDIVFIGDGELNDKIVEEAKKLGISKRVHVLGLRKDIPQLLAGCDIGCLSTKWDGFGLVAVEYMAAGLPVLVTDVPGLREVVGNKEALFSYQDHEMLGFKIDRLIKSPKYYADQKKYSLERCRLFDIKKMTSSYNNLYVELFDNNSKY